MVDRRVTTGTPVGLLARPAAQLVQKVAALSIDVTTGKDGAGAVEVRSIMPLLPLGIAGGGGEVVLTSTDDDAAAALDELAAFLAAPTAQ